MTHQPMMRASEVFSAPILSRDLALQASRHAPMTPALRHVDCVALYRSRATLEAGEAEKVEPGEDNNRSTREASIMSRKAEIVAVLGRHIDRPIRTFLADREIQGTPIEDAFWDAVYLNDPEIPFDRAVALVGELERSAKRVGTVLEGWRPLVPEGKS